MNDEEHEYYSTQVAARFEPNKIPDSITRKLFVSYGIGKYVQGRIIIDDTPHSSGDECFARIPLTIVDVTIILPTCKIDVKGKLLELLHDEKRKVIAENHMRLKAVEDKISNLLAIDHMTDEVCFGVEKGPR